MPKQHRHDKSLCAGDDEMSNKVGYLAIWSLQLKEGRVKKQLLNIFISHVQDIKLLDYHETMGSFQVEKWTKPFATFS